MPSEDRSEGTESNANVNALMNNAQRKNHLPSVNEYAPKARKPYTISKQREKWTEEEHTKFIEALKLYGRAWRRIEEHVGTKTAVQIRSHAQKFFSKVVRESNTDDASPVKPIEIPPPRPKRKPSHPYPRKMVASSKAKTLVGEQPRRSPSPNLSNSEQDNQSPTSVFYALGSEMFDTTEPTTPNGSQSPVSSANIVNTSCFSSSEPNSSPMGTDSQLLDQLTDSSDPDEPVLMKLELFPQESIFGREEYNEAPALQSLKLFGKTVLVSDSHRTLSSTKVTNKMINETSVCSLSWSINPFSTLSSSLFHEDIKYQLHTPIPTKAYSFLIANEREVTTNWETEREFFRLSSNNEENKPQSKLVDVHNDNASSSGQRASPKTSPRGFVPYKRCLAERETQLSTMANEEREEQRIRLCL